MAAVRQVQLIEQHPDDQARIYTEVRVCALLYCKTLRQMQDMRYAARPDGVQPRLSVVDRSPLPGGQVSLNSAGGNTRVDYLSVTAIETWGAFINQPGQARARLAGARCKRATFAAQQRCFIQHLRAWRGEFEAIRSKRRGAQGCAAR